MPPAAESWASLPDKRKARIALRVGVFVAAAVALLVVCRQGTSLFTVGCFFVLYVAAATLWIRGQYQASIDAVLENDESKRPWTFPYKISGPVAGAGVVIAVLGAVLNLSTALLAGVLMTYLGLGYALMRFRMYDGGSAGSAAVRVKCGLWAMGGAIVLVLIGLAALEATGFAAVPLVIGLLLAPIGLSLLAEPKIREFQQPGQSVVLYAVAGGVLLAVDVLIAVARVDTQGWIVGAFLALALLVLAIVSSTQADIAVVIGAVALMGVTAMSEQKPDALEPQPGQARLLVALGDSYMSGEGASVFYREDDDPSHENHCNRAPTAWAAVAGQTERLFDSVAFLACSGARTFNVRHVVRNADGSTTNGKQYNEPGTQLDQVDDLRERLGGKLDPSLVVVSLGGNDAGFATIGMTCLAPGDCSEKKALWVDNLPKVGAALSATYGEIRREFPDAPVLVTAYPAPISTADGGPCDQIALSKKDVQFVGDFLERLNETVANAARAHKFYFLGEMENALADAHLQLCDDRNSDRPGINFIGLRSVAGVAEQRFNPANWYHNSLHPNERGHAAMLQVFERWRAEHPDPPRDDPAAGTAAVRAAGGTPEPPCDLVKSGQSTKTLCQDEAAKWARGQIAGTILWSGWGLQAAVAALGAWLLAVALFGWRKPWWG